MRKSGAEVIADLAKKGFRLNPATGMYEKFGPVTIKPAEVKSPAGSVLERTFVGIWEQRSGQILEREVHLIPGRMFRVDFLHRPSKTVIEIEGYGLGHVSKKSFKKDADKYFMLQIGLGYEVVRLTKHLITDENIKALIQHITKKLLH